MKNKKVITDTETTGLDPKLNGVHQISGVIMIEDQEVERFNFKVKPFEEDLIEPAALKVSGVTYDEVMTYPAPKDVHEQLCEVFKGHCNKFNKNDKFHFIAYNSPFDNQHYREWFKKCDDKYFGSWFFTPDICVMRQAALYLQNERHLLRNFQLKTVAEYLKVIAEDDETIQWHDAMTDVLVTKCIYYRILNGEP